jgi:hypothetical protein
VEVHGAVVELHKIKWELVNSEAGLQGMFDIDLPDSLERPLDRASSFGDFFRAAKKAGYISSVPAELR